MTLKEDQLHCEWIDQLWLPPSSTTQAQRRALISLEWFSFIGYCLSLSKLPSGWMLWPEPIEDTSFQGVHGVQIVSPFMKQTSDWPLVEGVFCTSQRGNYSALEVLHCDLGSALDAGYRLGCFPTGHNTQFIFIYITFSTSLTAWGMKLLNASNSQLLGTNRNV